MGEKHPWCITRRKRRRFHFLICWWGDFTTLKVASWSGGTMRRIRQDGLQSATWLHSSSSAEVLLPGCSLSLCSLAVLHVPWLFLTFPGCCWLSLYSLINTCRLYNTHTWTCLLLLFHTVLLISARCPPWRSTKPKEEPMSWRKRPSPYIHYPLHPSRHCSRFFRSRVSIFCLRLKSYRFILIYSFIPSLHIRKNI